MSERYEIWRIAGSRKIWREVERYGGKSKDMAGNQRYGGKLKDMAGSRKIWREIVLTTSSLKFTITTMDIFLHQLTSGTSGLTNTS
jgi:hypothetical protein